MLRKAGLGALLLLALLVLVVLFNLFKPPVKGIERPELAYSDMLDLAATKQMHSAALRGSLLLGDMTDGRKFQTYLPDDPGLAARLAGQGVRVLALPPEDPDAVLRFFLSWIPALVLFGVLTAALRRIGRGLSKIEAQIAVLATATQHQASRNGPSPNA